MVAGVSDVGSTWLLPLWVAGVVVLAIVLGYAIYKAGYLRRGERERLDRTTSAVQRAEERSEIKRAEAPSEPERAPPLQVDPPQQISTGPPQEEVTAASPQETPWPRPGARNIKRRRKRR